MRLDAASLVRTLLLGFVCAVVIGGHIEDAWAFCRTTTCDVGHRKCVQDGMGCSAEGLTLTWSGHCVGVQVGEGSTTRGISATQVEQVVDRALSTWSQASCGHEQGPSFEFTVTSAPQALAPAFDGHNAVHFRDRDWPHHDLHTNVALTTLSIDRLTGRILDADIELNSFAQPFFSREQLSKYDLELVLLHETGHVLGLSHSSVGASKMAAEYAEPTNGLRWLATDDEQAICSVYPAAFAASTCSLSDGAFALCDTLEHCRWVAVVLLSMCWAVFAVLWRYRFQLYRRP
jgi:hypothetical protein